MEPPSRLLLLLGQGAVRGGAGPGRGDVAALVEALAQQPEFPRMPAAFSAGMVLRAVGGEVAQYGHNACAPLSRAYWRLCLSTPPSPPPNHRHRIATLNFEGAGCCLVPTSGHTWPSIWRPCLSTAERTSAEQGQPLLRRGSRELLLPRLRDRRIGAGQGSSSRGTLPRLCQTPRRTRSALWCTATLVALFVQSANSSPGAFQSDQHTIPHKHSAYDKRDDTTTHLHATSRQNCCRAD